MVVLNSTFNNFRPPAIVLPQSKLRLIEGHVLNMDLGLQMRDMGMSSKYGFKEETPQNLTPKFVKELAKEVLGNNKTSKMFQAMPILSQRMGNLGLKITH